MNEKIRSIVSMMLVVAIAVLIAFPFAPAFASEAEVTAAPEAIVAGQPNGGTEVPWEVTSLDISKDIDVVTAPGVKISLEKTASASYIEMMLGETKDITFTIDVGAQMSDSYYIAGNIFVLNTGDWPADVIAVSDTVWYKAGGPNWLPATTSVSTTVPMGDNAIPTGGPYTYSYSGTFTLPVPLSSVTAMSNLIEITISNKPNPPKPGMQDWTFHYRQDFAKPSSGGDTVVSLEDIESITPATGLSYEIKSVTINGSAAGSLTGPWSLDMADAPFTVVIDKELTAEKVGTYTLNNKAKIGDLEDDVDVEIVVKEPEGKGRITGEKIDFTTQEPVEGVKFVLEGEEFYAEAFSDENGFFDFGWLTPGDYRLYEVVPDGWVSVTRTEHDISLEEGEEEHFVFMNKRLSTIYGYKWLDVNGDGVHQDSEPALKGVTITLDGMGVRDETITGKDGYFTFTGLLDGQYIVAEEVPEGYYATSAIEVGVILEAGEEKRVDFLNAPFATVEGMKYLDLNSNGQLDEGEAGLSGVTIRLLDEDGKVIATTVSGSDGSYSFKDLKAGKYSVEEIVADGYVATAPISVSFSLAPGEQKTIDFFNNVQIGGEVITPPAVIAPAQPEASETLPVTGFEMSWLLLMIGLLILSGAIIASYGLVRMAHTR